AAVALLAEVARRRGLAAMTLTAVYGAEAVWSRHGFRVVDDPELRAKLAAYGAACFMVRTLD
ncbi:MAG: GNAT family N-acetyltransferase, partial [Blastochloris sp.]|nr:GNAT family N-acetyltransferase [Blastochloris sp.]